MPEALKNAVRWIRSLDANVENHRKVLDETTGMAGEVMRYNTLPAEQTKLESHIRMVDLQYTLSGSEGIGWLSIDGLSVKSPYDAQRDVIFYNWQAPDSILWQKPGYFTILSPEDAHSPKIKMPGSDSVVKLVVKIPVTTFFM